MYGLLSLQCVLQASCGDGSDKELEAEELEDVHLRLKESMQIDSRHGGVWSTLGLILLRTGRLQVRKVFSLIKYLISDFVGELRKFILPCTLFFFRVLFQFCHLCWPFVLTTWMPLPILA